MVPTPTDEVRAARHALAARLGNDIRRIAAEARQREAESGRAYVTLAARVPQPEGAGGQPPGRAGAA